MVRKTSLLKAALFLVYFAVGYLFIFAVLPFGTGFMIAPETVSFDSEEIRSPSDETTYAYILDDRLFSLESRVALLEEAEETIDISTFSAFDSETKRILFGAILDAADRGVEVRFLIDGVTFIANITGNPYLDALREHENVSIRLYEPFNPFLPHTINNRLHDKMFIIDEQYATSGGRNMDDRYFLSEGEEATYDRDILIFGEEDGHGTIKDMRAYYEKLYESNYTRDYRGIRQADPDVFQSELKASYESFHKDYGVKTAMNIIHEDAITVERASFIHNPIHRGMKYPSVLKTLSELAADEDEWFIQSPYFIFSEAMVPYLPKPEGHNITVLTNNIAESPNAWARGAYLLDRDTLVEHTTLYEFQSRSSLHAKTMRFGDDLSVIGAFNVDPRSTFLSTENMIVVYSEEFSAELDETLDYYLEQSLEVDTDGTLIEDGETEALEPSFRRMVSLRLRSAVAYFFDYLF